MKTRKSLALLLVCTMLLTLLAGCGKSNNSNNAATDNKKEDTSANDKGSSLPEVTPPAEPTGGPVANDTPVVVYASGACTTLDPYTTNGTVPNWVYTNIFETLVTVASDGTIVPQLAESWEASEDGLTYTFKLVQDSYFTNGENVKASDVVWSINYAKENVKRATYYGPIESAAAIDDYTVEIKLASLSPMFLAYLYYIPVLSEKFAADGGDIANEACGSGPYKIASWDSAGSTVLEAVEDYRLGAPNIKTVEIRHVADASSAQVSFEAGEMQVMEVTTSAAQGIIDSGAYNVQLLPTLHCTCVLINNKLEPLNNQLVRKALTYAIDKEGVIDIAYDGFADELRMMADTDSFGVDFSDAEDISYDPEKAKELLAEAGYPDGINFADYGIQLNTLTTGYYEKVAQVVQSNWADIGVDVEIVGNSNASTDISGGNYGFFVYGYAYKTDFSYSQAHYTTANIGGSNGSHFSDSYVDEAFAKGDATTDPAERQAIYKDLTTYLVDQCPNIGIFKKNLVIAYDKDLYITLNSDVNHQYFFYDWYWTAA